MKLVKLAKGAVIISFIILTTACTSGNEKPTVEIPNQKGTPTIAVYEVKETPTVEARNQRETSTVVTNNEVEDFWNGPEAEKIMEIVSTAPYILNYSLVVGDFSKIYHYFAPPSAVFGLGSSGYGFPITIRNLTDTTGVLACNSPFPENREGNGLFFIIYKNVTSTKPFTQYDNLRQVYNENSVGLVVTQEYDAEIHYGCEKIGKGGYYQVNSMEGSINVCYFLSKSKDGLWKIFNIQPFNSSDFCDIFKGTNN